MIYKMELSDSVDTMVFDLLEVPIVDKDITGIAENTTIDGNVYEDYLWLKKQYVQKWSIMCQDEYDRLRGFWTRQFGNAEVPFYRLFYGSNIYEDRNFLTSDGFTQILNPTERLAPTSLTHLYGNATQETLSGKNLYDFTDTWAVGAHTTASADGKITTTFDNTAGSSSVYDNYYTDASSLISPSTNYYVVCEIFAVSGNAVLVPVSASGTQGQFATGTGDISFTNLHAGDVIVFQGTTRADLSPCTTMLRTYCAFGAGKSGSITYRISVQKEATTASTFVYEPYCGGSPMPNPQFPSPVETVTGAQTVKITGKNLWGIASEYDRSQSAVDFKTMPDGSISANGTATATAYSMLSSAALLDNKHIWLNAGTYTLSVDSALPTGINVYLMDADSNETIGSGLDWNHTSRTIDVNKTARAFIRLRISSGITVDTTIKPMLVKGSTAEPFEPHQSQSQEINLGSLELAKIGDYTDGIYNDNGTWKIHKAIEKVVFDGTENMTAYRTNNVFSARLPVPYDAMPSAVVLSDYFLFQAFSDFYNDAYREYGKITVHNSAATNTIYASAQNSSISNITDFKAWFSTHNTTVYYALATPTDTEITDSELIEQLNHIYELYQGTNNVWLIPSAGAQGEIEGTYRLIYDEETDIVPKTPVVLTLTDGGVINPCGCRQNIQLIMRETEGN